jgi:hypothetical protein
MPSFLQITLASETHLAEGHISPEDHILKIENSLLHRADAQR